jgi:G:T-mismatch repair DNA endonuclease (very short patch repair protein)
LKQCMGCQRSLVFKSFGKQKLGKYGLRSQCRECTNLKSSATRRNRLLKGKLGQAATPCKVCGRPLFPVGSKVPTFCSNPCRVIGGRTGVLKVCAGCGRDMYNHPCRPRQRYCSRDCMRRHANPSGFELAVGVMLGRAGATFEAQRRFGRWYADFYVPSARLVIECNGCYYHACETCGLTGPKPNLRDRNRRKADWFRARGYRFAVVWEHEFNAGIAERIIREAVGVL